MQCRAELSPHPDLASSQTCALFSGVLVLTFEFSVETVHTLRNPRQASSFLPTPSDGVGSD